MSKISKLKKSRADWKEKAVDRTKTIKYQKAELKRIKKERDEYKAQFQKTKQELEKEQKKTRYPSKTRNRWFTFL